MEINTDLLHNYPVVDSKTGASSIPKYQASTFAQKECYANKKGYLYTRFGNPTVDALERGLEKLEGASHALVFSSGMAAISSVLMLLHSGDHVLLPHEVYGGTFQFAHDIMPNYNIETSFTDLSSLDNIESKIKPNTKMIYIETPSNPLLKVTDIKAVTTLAKKHHIITVADNTFMTPIYQHPLDLGVDIVIESCTKFINGHSDVVAGMASTNNDQLFEKLFLFQKEFGAILGVEDAWLILRGMKTLGIRMEKSVKNAQSIAKFLNEHANVTKVFYPGLPNHPNANVQLAQAHNGGAVLSFTLKNLEALEKFIKCMKIPILAVSLGGVESIISHPATMSHAALTPQERQEQGISDTLLRMSCGIEDINDLLADLAHALE